MERLHENDNEDDGGDDNVLLVAADGCPCGGWLLQSSSSSLSRVCSMCQRPEDDAEASQDQEDGDAEGPHDEDAEEEERDYVQSHYLCPCGGWRFLDHEGLLCTSCAQVTVVAPT